MRPDMAGNAERFVPHSVGIFGHAGNLGPAAAPAVAPAEPPRLDGPAARRTPGSDDPHRAQRRRTAARSSGYPVDATPGVAGGYRLGAGAALPPLLLDDDEAVAVAVGLRTAAGGRVAGIEEASLRALAKLEQVLPAAAAPPRRAPSRRSPFRCPRRGRPSTPHPDHARRGVPGPAAAAVRLPAARRHEGRRDVEPHRLVHAGRRWYLVAWDVGRQAWRTFRVDRVSLRPHPAGPRFAPRRSPTATRRYTC